MPILNVQVSSSLVLPSYEPKKIYFILENGGKRPPKVIESKFDSFSQLYFLKQ